MVIYKEGVDSEDIKYELKKAYLNDVSEISRSIGKRLALNGFRRYFRR